MGDIEEVQEQMKADMEALKDQMTSMIEAMLSMKRIIESNMAATATEADPTHPSAINQANQPIPDVLGQGGEVLGSTSGPHVGHNNNAYPYGLPPNYTPPTMHMPNENANHVVLVTFEGQQPQPIGGVREEPQEHAQGDFDPYPTFTTEGPTFNVMPRPNTAGAPQPRPLQSLHFSVEGSPPTMEGRKRLDLIKERLRAVERFGDYPFVDMEKLCLVLDVVIPPKFKVSDFDRYKGTTYPMNHLKMYCQKMRAYSRDEKLLMHFFQESLVGVTVIWYTNLKAFCIRTWKDLIIAFIR
ncbi:uncharacterized protein [Glycine max]|uniref:uncharacterized protein n=1 Tax=Glycine max TaxID=3847 RepID=UPI0003DE8898|nr:uncharacterized protein LOC112999784 [Glycine max]|eukprot:XP_025981881.1 uncharacterized protein LOC112999784 [Glycine max]